MESQTDEKRTGRNRITEKNQENIIVENIERNGESDKMI